LTIFAFFRTLSKSFWLFTSIQSHFSCLSDHKSGSVQEAELLDPWQALQQIQDQRISLQPQVPYSSYPSNTCSRWFLRVSQEGSILYFTL